MVLVREGVGGGVEAAASLTMAGRHVVVSCHMTPRAEHCSFYATHGSWTADDTLVSAGNGLAWERRYSDGVKVRIHIEGSRPVPAPVPLGR